MKDDWQPISTAPHGAVVLRWHKIWRCPIAVERVTPIMRRDLPQLLDWIEATRAQTWPEEAFTPHWRPLGFAPQEHPAHD